MVFSKAPKAPKVVFFLFLIFFQNSMVVVFLFLAETLKLWSSFSWFFPKFPKSSFSWLYLQIHGLLLPGFFQNSQSCYLLFGFSQSSMPMVFLCCFWLLVNMPIIIFSSLGIYNSEIFKLPPHVLCSNN
jgi:hypothetical protein